MGNAVGRVQEQQNLEKNEIQCKTTTSRNPRLGRSEFGVEDTEKHGRGIKPSKRPYFRWTEEQLEQLATLRDEGKSAAEIAEALGVSRDKVITKLAAMAARQRAGSKTPEQSTEPVPETEAEPEQEAETELSVEAEPEPAEEPVEPGSTGRC